MVTEYGAEGHPIKTQIIMKVNMWMIKRVDMGFFNGQVGIYIKEIILMI